MDYVKFFKGCLTQILLGPFLNTFPQMLSKMLMIKDSGGGGGGGGGGGETIRFANIKPSLTKYRRLSLSVEIIL